MTDYERFQQAETALLANPNDKQAQFIVNLWNAGVNLKVKNTRLQAAVDTLKEEVKNLNLSNADYVRRMDLVESKLAARKDGVVFNPAAFFAAQEALVAAGQAVEE